MSQPPRRINTVGGTFAALIAGLLLTASGCSTDHAAPPPPAAAPTATAAAADSAERTREQGAAKYLEIVTPINAGMDKCLPVLNPVLDSEEASPSDLREIRAACADMPKVNRQFAEDLASNAWPAEAREAIGQLIDETRFDQLAWQDAATARTTDELFDPSHPFSEDDTAADLVRAHLGLPASEDVKEG